MTRLTTCLLFCAIALPAFAQTAPLIGTFSGGGTNDAGLTNLASSYGPHVSAPALLPPMPPAIKAPMAYKAATVTKGAAQLKPNLIIVPPPSGMVLSWGAPTNSFYVIMASTNLTTWYFKTNAVLNATNVFIPSTVPSEFYRAYTALQMIDGCIYVQSLNYLTNAP